MPEEDKGDWLNELCRMLHPTTRLDVRLTASSNVMMLTGSDEGRLFIRQNKPLLEALFQTLDDPNVLIQKDAIHSLVNLSSDDVFNHITLQQYNIIPTLIRCITVARSPFADKASSILSNMTRNETAAKAVFEKIEKQLDLLLGIYTKIDYNTADEKQHMDYLGQVFANMTQCKLGRTFILNRDHLRIQKLIPFINHESITRRGSTCIMLKNICFDSEVNSWLLGASVDLLPTLLKPLCGKEIANLDDDEMDKLPVDLQYLDEDIEMEADSDIRLMLVETLMLLCNRKQDRTFVRDSSTYIVLRELHKVEMAEARESEINRIIQQVIDIMISDDADVDDIRTDVDIPEEVQTKLNDQTEEEKNDIERYKRGEIDDEEETLNTVIMA